MRLFIRRVSVALLAAVAGAAIANGQAAAPVPTPAEGDLILRDFAFDSGERLPELKIHYQTLGTLHRGANGHVDNAVLVLHGTGGTGKQFLTPNFAGVLFGPGQLLDTTRYFVVMPDGIGHGGSSKPSNGLHARFPHYGYRDMIRAQHRLLTEGLSVDHLRLVIGTSMGGMHTWLWGETYPDFMDALMPLASLPTQIAGRNRMMRRTAMDSIKSDPEWKGGEYEPSPKLADRVIYTRCHGQQPAAMAEERPNARRADRYSMSRSESAQEHGRERHAVPVRRLAGLRPGPALETIRAPSSVNSADDEVNPPELGIWSANPPCRATGRAPAHHRSDARARTHSGPRSGGTTWPRCCESDPRPPLRPRRERRPSRRRHPGRRGRASSTTRRPFRHACAWACPGLISWGSWATYWGASVSPMGTVWWRVRSSSRVRC